MSTSARVHGGQRPARAATTSYVTFMAAGETYAVPADRVREVIAWTPVTRLPNSAPFVKGVINLRGEIVAVIDIRLRLGLPTVEPTDRTCIVVVMARHLEGMRQTGLVVDRALEVTRVAPGDLAGTDDLDPSLGAFVTGVARTRTGLAMLLDVDRLLAKEIGPAA